MASIAEQRRAAVADTIARIRAIEAEQGVTRDGIEAIRQTVVELAKRADLFPRETFAGPDREPGDRIFRLSEDPDRRFALYLNAAFPGVESPPHDHTTWAVIAGIDGEEHQKVYRRTDDGNEPGKGTVEVDREFTVTPGTGIGFMPDDIHSIHVLGEQPILHLHMYGRALETMTERVAYDTEAGTYAVFPAHPSIQDDPQDD